MDTEKWAPDSTVCCPTVAPHLDRKPLIIMAMGEVDSTEPKASGK